MLPIRTILCPIDLSPLSLHAFEAACMFAEDYKSQLVILYVQQPAVPLGGLVETEPPGEIEQLRRRIAELKVPPIVIVERRIEVGPIDETIIRVAGEVHCDVIVMGTHGRSGLGRAFVGSVAESVLRKTACMVLIVKSGTEKGARAPSGS